MKKVVLYSDGGSINNGHKNPNTPVYGACSTILVNKNNQIQKIINNLYTDVTNNQMELIGAIQGLEYMTNYNNKINTKNEKIEITLVSDSQYLIKGCQEWLNGWKKNNWKNSTGKVIPNLSLWKIIDNYINNTPNFIIKYRWVKGHKGKNVTLEESPDIYFNEMCDSELSKLLDEKRKEL